MYVLSDGRPAQSSTGRPAFADASMRPLPTAPSGIATAGIERVSAIVKAIASSLEAAWESSKNGTTSANEYCGAIVLRDAATIIAVNRRSGGKGHARPKLKGHEIDKSRDAVIGDFHTHPYAPDEIKEISGAYNWDGSGTGPSPYDFSALKISQVSVGFISIIESGNVQFAIEITDRAIYDQVFGDLSVEMGMGKTIEAAILDRDNMERNPEAKHPMSYPDVYVFGLIQALEENRRLADVDTYGFSLYRIDRATALVTPLL